MSEVQPQSRDRVRVIVESTVDQAGYYQGIAYVEEGRATVEILERADDPSRDLIGTVAEFDGLVWVKTGPHIWTEVGDPDHFRVDALMVGRVVTGTVPGTPAAAAKPGHDYAEAKAVHVESEACGDYSPKGKLGGIYYTVCLNCGFGGTAHGKREPLVVQYGDPEPDRARRFASAQSGRVEWGTFGWRMVHHNGDAVINVPWTGIPAEFFPMAEVVVEP